MRGHDKVAGRQMQRRLCRKSWADQGMGNGKRRVKAPNCRLIAIGRIQQDITPPGELPYTSFPVKQSERELAHPSTRGNCARGPNLASDRFIRFLVTLGTASTSRV